MKREALVLPVRKDSSLSSIRAPSIAIGLALVLAAQLACSRAGEDASLTARGGAVADTSQPGFVSLDRLETELSKLHGRGVLLNLWATWCAPCVAELPGLVETAHEFEGRGGQVVLLSYDSMVPGVGRDGALQLVEAFVSRRKIDVPVWIFEADNYDAINARFDLPGEIPVTLAIDRRGKIVDRQEGRADKRRWAEMMERALAP